MVVVSFSLFNGLLGKSPFFLLFCTLCTLESVQEFFVPQVILYKL